MNLSAHQLSEVSASEVSRHLVVGIGASAGGIAALRALFAEVPAQPGAAFVLAQHTAVGEDGLLIEALGPFLAMPVQMATDGALAEPDRLHVVPAGQVARLREGRFVLRPVRTPEERRTVIDRLFRSLAEDAGSCAVGVVLSGLGSDGALGLETIGAAGGLAMAQQPDTAAQPEMPGHAAATGMCDHVLPPEELGRTLMAYAAHVHRLPSGVDGVARHREVHAALPQVCDLLRRATGNDFRHYKSTTLVRRIERRMQVLQIAGIADYLDRLEDDGEARTLFRELLIGVTAFFRDADAFDALAAKVLAPLLAGRAQADELRIWVPGCATGEEAYSIAILVREALEGLAFPPRVQVFATDIDERALAVARRGSYPQGIAAQMSPERLARFFVRKGRRYQVRAELREMCVFTAHNLISDPPFSRLDLISCRNLLIYLGPHLQKKLFPVFHYALKPGGYLFLGSSESLAGQGELFRAVEARSRLAQRKEVRSAPPGGLRDFGGSGMPGFRGPDQMAEPDLGAIAQRILLAEFAPRYAIVSDQGQVIHLSEGVDKYLQPPVGSFSGTVTRMARRGLSAGLRSALGQAVQRRRMVVHELPSVQTSEGPVRLRLTVQPMPELGHGDGLYMIVFEDLGDPASRAQGEPGPGRPDAEAVIETLERELARAREDVERAAQDQEAANEELKSSNEELLSMNEELQSANEELEASKEDVQAANRQLEQANADLENLLRSTQIATVFLDSEGLVRSFTPAAVEIYNLRPTDAGRSLDELRSRLPDLPDLPPFNEVAARSEPLEHLARHADGRWFLRRVLPYRSGEGCADGVLVTFVDISTQKRAEEDRERATALLSAVGETTPDLIFVKDRQGRLLYANPATLRVIGRPAEEVLGRSERDYHDTLAEAEAIAAADAEVIAAGETRVIEERFTSPDGGTRIFRSTKSPMRDETGAVTGLIGVSTDVTQAKKAEEALRAALEFNRRILDSSGDCISVLSLEGRLESMSSGGLCAMEVDDFAAIRGAHWPDAWQGEAQGGALLALEEARQGRTGRFRGASPTHRGTPRYWDVVVTPILGADGLPEKLLAIARDVSEERLAEDRLRDSEARYRALVEVSPQIVWFSDAMGSITYVNPQWTDFSGLSLEDTMGQGWLRAIDPEHRERVAQAFGMAVATEGDYEVEIPFRRATDGAIRWHLARGLALRDHNGRVARWVGVAVDIHERHATEERLRETSRQLDAVLNNTTMAVFLMDDHQHCVFANAAAESLTGYRFGEMQGRPLHDVLHHTRPDGTHYPLEECPIDRAFPENNQTQGEEVFVHRDGSFYPVAFTASPIQDSDGRTVGTVIEARGIAADIAAQKALAESEAKFRTIANAMPQMVWSTLPDGYHDFYNDRWYEFTGTPPGSTDGEGWSDMFHPDDREEAWSRWRQSLVTGELYEVEYRLRHRSGAYRWVLGRALPVRNETGAIVRWMGTCTDIEDRKRTEAELAEALAAKEVLLHEVNHRVKNSLQLVTSLLMLQAGQAKDPQLRQALLEARGRLSVVASMHQRLYSTSQHDRVDFGEYLRDMAAETLRSLSADDRVTLRAEVEADVVVPLQQAVPLALVVSELVTNSVKYAFAGREKGCLLVALCRAPNGARIEVADDGVGLPEGFDPARSVGLGMKIVTALVRQVRGTLEVVSHGPGATFVINVPFTA